MNVHPLQNALQNITSKTKAIIQPAKFQHFRDSV